MAFYVRIKDATDRFSDVWLNAGETQEQADLTAAQEIDKYAGRGYQTYKVFGNDHRWLMYSPELKHAVDIAIHNVAEEMTVNRVYRTG